MHLKLKQLSWTLAAALIVILTAPTYMPASQAYAVPSAQDMLTRIETLTGLTAAEIDGLYAVEQRADIVMINFDITIPVMRTPRANYLLIRNGTTGEWLRILIDNAEWRDDFRPYLEAEGVKIHKQKAGTFESMTPAAEAAILAPNDIDPAVNANMVLYGDTAAPEYWQSTAASDFPDAAIVIPADMTGDVGMNSVGALQGEGGVSGGQARYSIPIVVPPGRKNMEPAVALNYSSSSGNGVAGVGWSLSATSAITRCGATVAQDGFTASVQYSATRDRLCMDGQRLVVTLGNYGEDGAQYRTELDTFSRITQSGSINSGTSSFTIESKSGRISQYGATSDSRHFAAGRTEVMVWAASNLQDRSGNTITYSYTNFGDGEHLIAAIHYTGINGSDGDRHVRFGYEQRPDFRTSYGAGGKTRSTQRLKTISTEYQSELIRRYTLNYDAVSVSTSRSLLRNVQECAYESDGTAHCLPSTTFEWQEGAPTFARERLQFSDPNNLINGIGDPVTGREIVLDDKRWLHEVIPSGDQNGDGVGDWPNINVNAEGQVTGTFSETLANCFRPSFSLRLTCLQPDFNVDGLTDSFRSNNQLFEFKLTGTTAWVSTGIKWGDNGPANGSRHDRPLAFTDFNGDGWADLAIKQNSQLWIYFHTQSLTSPYSISQRQKLLDYVVASSGYADTTSVQISGDMDGNGTPDVVVLRPSGVNEAPGFPVPDYIILTHSNAGGAMTTSTRGFTNLALSPTTNAHFFHDVNGDGLQDLVSVSDTNDNLQYRPNDGVSFVGDWQDLGFRLPMRTATYRVGQALEWETFTAPAMSKVLVMDYDGDGKEEMLYANFVLASSCALIPQGPGLPNAWKCDDDLYSEYDEVNPAGNYWPINAGEVDNSVRLYRGYRLKEDASGGITGESFSTLITASATQAAVVDATGDGLPDVVTVFGCRQTSNCEFNTETAGRPGTVQSPTRVPGAYLVRNVGTAAQTGAQEFEFAGHDLMKATQDGFGNRNEWTYRPLSSDSYDTDSSDFYQTTHSYQAADPDYFHFASSMNVVADHRASNGVGGLRSTKYRYRGAIFNNKGRGFQGFRSTITEQDVYPTGHPLSNTDKVIRSDFHQKWPISGRLEQSCTWLEVDVVANDNPTCANPIAKVTTDSIHNVATDGGARFVAIESRTQEQFDLISRQLMMTTQSQSVFDAAGNVTSQTSSYTDDWSSRTSQVSKIFDIDWNNWWLVKILSETSTKSPITNRHVNAPAIAPNTDLTKIVTLTINDYDLASRLPKSVTTTANDSPLSTTTTTQYNVRGLTTSVSMVGTDVTGPRTVTTTYSDNGAMESANGYFPFVVTNALGHQSRTHTSPRHGQSIRAWDQNDLETTVTYDSFGRVSDIVLSGSPKVSSRYFWCTAQLSCPANAVFLTKSYGAGQPEQQVFVDGLGRKVQSSVQNFSGTGDISVTVEFDERGNALFESVPHDLSKNESSLLGTRYVSYDALDRLLEMEIDQADDSVFSTTYSYDGLKTSINADGLLMHRVYSGNDQLIETKDAEGGYTRYAYDASGNTIALQDAASNTITASYNALGHKQWVDDPNMGLRSFSYNATGEVRTENDANGNTIATDYDVLGRVVESRVNGTLVGSWHYDGSAPDKGLGLLDYEDSHSRSAGGRLRKHYSYSLSASGRKDLIRVRHQFFDDANDLANSTIYDTEFYTDAYYARPTGLRYPGGIGVGFLYNQRGYLIKEKDASSDYVIREVLERDSRNNVVVSSLTDGLLTQTAHYYEASGQMQSNVVSGASVDVHDLYYEYDRFGNLDYQRVRYGGAVSTETFVYDDLHRLIRSERTLPGGTSVINYDYDAAGNLTLKDDYASLYTYDAARPNAVASITKVAGGTVSFDYDANGNMKTGDGKSLTYNAFNKPVSISSSSSNANFYYGADQSRYMKTEGNGDTTLYLDKLMEIVLSGSGTEYRHYIGGIAILTKQGSLSDPSPAVRYTHKDRLGSLSTLTDDAGVDVQTRGFDPFGKPRDGDWADRDPATLDSTITDRGFTEHEHLDEFQLIHMNGRVYDYNLGRFLSVDPIIQAPGNSQSLNPYSYIMNNPLSGTDPSGYTASCSGDTKRKCTGEWRVKKAGSRVSQAVKFTATIDENGEVEVKVHGGSAFGSSAARREAVFEIAAALGRIDGIEVTSIKDLGSQEDIGDDGFEVDTSFVYTATAIGGIGGVVDSGATKNSQLERYLGIVEEHGLPTCKDPGGFACIGADTLEMFSDVTAAVAENIGAGASVKIGGVRSGASSMRRPTPPRRASSDIPVTENMAADVADEASNLDKLINDAALARTQPHGPISKIQFGRVPNQVEHAFRHTDAVGLSRADLRIAIARRLRHDAASLSLRNGLNVRTIRVNDIDVTVNAYLMPDGTLNVGRITTPR